MFIWLHWLHLAFGSVRREMKVAYPQFQQVHFGVRSTPPALMEDSFLGDSGTSIVQVVCSRAQQQFPSCRVASSTPLT